MTMFGLTIEKLFLVALIAAVIIGPRRLPEYAGRLGALVRRVTLAVGEAARRAEQEAGVASIRQEWTAVDPRRYDPRQIIREAWDAGEESDGSKAAEAPQPEPEGRWIVAGSSGHPRRVWKPAEAEARVRGADLLD
ncbi:twin-arginine translocase TatA/TatE family subunit [Microbacterium sp.]|uniref:Sec-independent protein translocase subunit TatA/TatB n=1 Tax=Microbacterium sp. TaxID=51671 RepID=UPI00356802B4